MLSPTCSNGVVDPGQIFSMFMMGLLTSQCRLGDPKRFPPDHNPDCLLPEYDFVVVGAGSGGATLASRLAENRGPEKQNWTVVLIEAGDNPTAKVSVPYMAAKILHTEEDWDFYTEPNKYHSQGSPNKQCYLPRGKMLGGTSSMNLMYYYRGHDRDYDEWVKQGNVGWDSKTMRQYFMKSEGFEASEEASTVIEREYHNTSGPLRTTISTKETDLTRASLLAAKELGYSLIDFNGKERLGFGRTQATIYKGERWSTARAFLSPMRDSKNLILIKKAEVTKILWDKNKRAVGVVYKKNGREYTIKAKKEVILSGGVFGSPKILLHSGVGPAEQLKRLNIDVISNIPVGENLQDHSRHNLFYQVKDSVFSDDDIYHYLKNRSGLLSMNTPIGFAGFVSTELNNDKKWPNIQIVCDYQPKGAEDIFMLFNKTNLEKFIRLQDGNPLYVFIISIMRPASRGRVFIESANPADRIKIESNYFAEKSDMDLLIEGVQLARRLASAPSLKNKLIKPIYVTDGDPESRAFWEEDIRNFGGSLYHPVGTCKMAPENDPSGVVDPKLRVKGVKGLRVVDASIIPTIPTANTNAPVIAIAEKAADLIKQDHNF